MWRPAFLFQIAAILTGGIAIAEQSVNGLVLTVVLLWVCNIALDTERRALRRQQRRS